MALTADRIMAAREELAEEGEPLHTADVTLVPNGGSLQHTTPAYAVNRYGLEAGEEVQVHTLRGRLLLVELPDDESE